jgi:hypothetical protein
MVIRDVKLRSCPELSQCVVLVFSQRDGRNQGIILGMIAADTVKICILPGHKLKALPHGKISVHPFIGRHHPSAVQLKLNSGLL